ncbi:hypothetical protein BG261_05345 [Floricoccus tropicus]|uniref:Bacteriophage Gp15 protein n=1 Tax=Floricoccus tropicus TaxID=1859473 RepID=A0A1E8GKN1_9LACT|nr:Gp15 family bacteriophage protein [Floricoccus tropicus]OFI48815.1 hypothetical protein BG261_05345 [Floricoccus tropicus]
MKLNDLLVNSIVFDGILYDLDLSFNNVLDVLEILNNKSLLKELKLSMIVKLLIGSNELEYGDKLLLWKEIFEKYINKSSKEPVELDLDGNPMPIKDSEQLKSEKPIDLTEDASYIYASFRQIGINLFDEQGKMHWEEFQAILEALPDDTIIQKIIKIRLWKPRKGETSEYKAQMRELQKKYRLTS